MSLGIWGLIAGLFSVGGGVVGAIIMHFVKKKEYKAKVASMESSTNIAENNSEVANAKKWQEVYDKTIEFISKELESERIKRSEQEANCDKKIGKLNQEMHILKGKIEAAEKRCVDGCFRPS